MCMSRLHQVLRLEGGGSVEVEDLDGVRHFVSLLALDGPTPVPGQWLTVHSGYAIDRVDAGEAEAVRDQLRSVTCTPRVNPEGEVRS
jgi:hydrogenase maturation factor